MSNSYTAKRVFIFALAAIMLFFISCWGRNDSDFLNKYLPFLDGIKIKNIRIKKIDDNDMFRRPYNIYVRFQIDTLSQVYLKKMFQGNQKKIDTNYLKRVYSPREYSLFYSMESINSLRNRNLDNSESWWLSYKDGIFHKENFFFSPYIEINEIGKLTFSVHKANGRVALYFRNNDCFVLVECWG